MSALLVSVLDDVIGRLSPSPRCWLKSAWQGHRDARGALVATRELHGRTVNCWCVSEAISLAVSKLEGTVIHLSELRSDVEREILLTVEEQTGRSWPALYRFNDAPATSHRDVMLALSGTRSRLRNAA